MFSRYKDTVAALVALVLGACFTFTGLRLPESQNTSVGPGTMPTLVGTLMMFFGVLLLIPALRDLKTDVSKKSPAVQGNTISLGSTVILLLLYIALWQSVGFVIMTFGYLILQFIVFCPTAKRSAKSYLSFAAIAAIATAVIYLVFSVGFKLTLPGGILG